MNSIFAVGAILSGVVSLAICHFRAVVDAQHRRHWSTAFVVAAGLLFCNGCITVALVPSIQGVNNEPEDLTECLEDVYQITFNKVVDKWLVNRNRLPATMQQQL